MTKFFAVLSFTCFFLVSCAVSPLSVSSVYDDFKTGRFLGVLTLQYAGPDQFLYVPDEIDPFRFVRSNGEVIQPEQMYTDGGSTPRFLWGIKNFSPFGYGPAYVIHDWLYTAHRCSTDSGPLGYSFADSAIVLAEGLKTLMEEKAYVPEFGHVKRPGFVELVYAASLTPLAKMSWNEACTQPRILPAYTYFSETRRFMSEDGSGL